VTLCNFVGVPTFWKMLQCKAADEAGCILRRAIFSKTQDVTCHKHIFYIMPATLTSK